MKRLLPVKKPTLPIIYTRKTNLRCQKVVAPRQEIPNNKNLFYATKRRIHYKQNNTLQVNKVLVDKAHLISFS